MLTRKYYCKYSLLLLILICVACLVLLNSTGNLVAKDQERKQTEDVQVAKKELGKLNGLIGDWRGVGMTKRGSRSGAWIEKAAWVWHFEKGTPSLLYNVADGKLMKSAQMKYHTQKKEFSLLLTLPDQQTRNYRGNWDKKKLVLESKTQADGYIYRITITPLNEKRTVVLQERRKPAQSFYSRIAEVGYTRKGASLAVAGADGPVCIVTGGKGTTPVTYKGQTYYVCCSGCKAAFEEDPEGIIAEYKKKIANQKK